MIDNTSNWETRRQKLIKMLTIEKKFLDLRFLLKELDYNNRKTLIEDIESIRKTLKSNGINIVIEPAYCIACGFKFQGHGDRLKIPFKCPKCKQQRIEWPMINIG